MIHKLYNYSDNPGPSDDIQPHTNTHDDLQPDLAHLK